ncbi:hypothetical protein K9L67_04565 [Candidatus Woesearchaeota archaeon]|nr:hypothetical protein [Candidatus Woesearchaeota archaeon]MCF7901472.1 hypothetical protein [Candidatus Woesearchaeota archaeon]MCF8013195.1 hypothetical protein [Candidatus Woesearchaeota archaeon]
MSKNKLWFRRKTYGWGWTPCTWQGWIVVIIFIILLFGVIEIFKYKLIDGDSIGFFLSIAFLCVALVFISHWKGEKPRWKWGDNK